jgi:hypothetical protein
MLGALLSFQMACDPVTPDGDGDADSDADGDADGDTEVCPDDWACCDDTECSDGIYCNGVEHCDRGQCENDPNAVCHDGICEMLCDDGLACTVDSCDERANTCVHQPDDDVCLDDNLCNGEERCVPADSDADEQGCISGSMLICDDDDDCTDDYCEDNACLVRLRDSDGDGHGDDGCRVCAPENPSDCDEGDDCDDGNPDVYPGATEICDDGADNNCDRRRDYADETCDVPNDVCADAILLERGDLVHSSTRGTAADIDSGCAPADSYDVVFAFNITEVQDVEIILATSGAREVNVALSADCGNADGDLKCTSGRSFTQVNRALAAGTYYVIISSAMEADFDITLDYDDPAGRPEGDQCSSAVDVTGGGSFSGSTEGFDPDYTAGCGDDTDRDATFSFTLDEAVALDLSLTATGQVAVAIQSTCGVPASEWGCFEGDGSAVGRVSSLMPGTYYLIVKSPEEVEFDIELSFSMTSADGCDAARDISEGGTFFGTTVGVAADIDTACGDPLGPDSVYRFRLSEEQDVTVDFRSTDLTTLSLTRGCDDPDREVRCASGTEFQLRGRGLAAGTYYLVATGTRGADFELDFTAVDPRPRPADDLCTGAIAISARGGSYTGDTIDCENDYESRCGDSLDLDTAYRFTIPDARSMDLTVEPSGPISVAIQSECGVVGRERSCFSTREETTRHFRSLDPGTYYLIFKTPEADTFSFSISFGAPEPTVIEPWIDNRSHTVVSPEWSYDDSQFNFDISPLSYPFNGGSFENVALATNGYIRFGNGGVYPDVSSLGERDTDIDDTYPLGNAQISWLADDGYPTENTTYFLDEANQRVVITLIGYHRFGQVGTNDIQIILYCDSGDIQISYRDCSFANESDHWAIGVSEPAHAGGEVHLHDFTTHSSGETVSFGPGAIAQGPEHTGTDAYLPLNDHAIYFQRSGTGWDVLVDELPF